MRIWSSLKAVKQQGSYRSGGIALINGIFEVCAKLIKSNDLKEKTIQKKKTQKIKTHKQTNNKKQAFDFVFL